MATNVKVEKNNNENGLALLRRFTKRTQAAGILRKVRSNRYFSRISSPNVRKKNTLQALGQKQKIEKLIKLGKLIPRNQK